MNHFDWPTFLPAFRRAAEECGFRVDPLGEVAAGPLLAFERPGPGPRVYLSAGIHGDEPAGPAALLSLMRDGFFAEGDCHWMICPALNPDGLAAGARGNGAGVDLNRDYLRQATREVRAHVEWIEARAIPDLFVSLHEDWETSGFYFYEINLGVDDPPRAASLLDAVGPWFEPESGEEIDGHTPRGIGWIYHVPEADFPADWPEAIYLAKRGCPLSFTLETPSRAELASRAAAHAAALKHLCADLRSRSF